MRACIASQPAAPFFIMAGCDETHRPFDRPGYDFDPPDAVTVPPWLPDIPPIREDIGQLNGMVKAVDEAVNLFNMINAYYIARTGDRLTIEDLRPYLPAAVPAEV